MQTCRLGYVIIYVPDVENAVAFYEQAFGLRRRFVHESGAYAEMETGATKLAFAEEKMIGDTCHAFKKNRLTDEPAGAEVAFITQNVRDAFAQALAAGAVKQVEPITKPWGQVVAYVRDLNGFLVQLCTEVGE